MIPAVSFASGGLFVAFGYDTLHALYIALGGFFRGGMACDVCRGNNTNWFVITDGIDHGLGNASGKSG